VVITDPPYSPHVHENMTSVGVVGLGGGGMGSHARDPGFEAIDDELRIAIGALVAGAKRWGVVFSDFEGAYLWQVGACFPWGATPAPSKFGAEYVRTVPWVRWSQPQLSGDRPPTGAEAVLHFHATRADRVRMHWNGPGSLTHYARRCMRGADKHPTEKPIDLMLDLVSWFSDPGECVLDPCAGAGTTGIACRLLERDAVLVEKDARWATHAQGRASSPLTARDLVRAQEWIVSTVDEAGKVPAPKAANGSDVKTWERAQRRIADAERCMANLTRVAA
jgi:hypothetical protein